MPSVALGKNLWEKCARGGEPIDHHHHHAIMIAILNCHRDTFTLRQPSAAANADDDADGPSIIN